MYYNKINNIPSTHLICILICLWSLFLPYIIQILLRRIHDIKCDNIPSSQSIRNLHCQQKGRSMVVRLVWYGWYTGEKDSLFKLSLMVNDGLCNGAGGG